MLIESSLQGLKQAKLTLGKEKKKKREGESQIFCLFDGEKEGVSKMWRAGKKGLKQSSSVRRTAERDCVAPGEPCGGSLHRPAGWVTLTGQLEDSLPRETLNGKNRARACTSTVQTNPYTRYRSTCKQTHTPCIHHKIISFSIYHTITEPLFIDLCHGAFHQAITSLARGTEIY